MKGSFREMKTETSARNRFILFTWKKKQKKTLIMLSVSKSIKKQEFFILMGLPVI